MTQFEANGMIEAFETIKRGAENTRARICVELSALLRRMADDVDSGHFATNGVEQVVALYRNVYGYDREISNYTSAVQFVKNVAAISTEVK